ncbi:MAG: hypothetical protein IPG71_04080 [bacterium]|nr:hypothetical protein [bacterium]
MATSFTPGLRVAETTVITKDRILPLRGNVTVHVGEHLASEQVVARTELPGNVTPLNAANLLGILPTDVRAALLVKENDKVEKGQVIARSKSLFGLFKNELKSPVSGSLESISDVTGQMIFRDPPVPVEIESYIEGRVTQIFPNEGVEVQAVGSFIQGIFGIGGETFGKLRMVASAPDELIDEAKIPTDCRHDILVGGAFATLEAVKKAIAGGAAALVVGGFDSLDLKKLLGYEQGVAITGGEQIGITLVLTEGFGRIAMARRTFDLLKGNEGHKASVSGATQIRAGVMRPEIIIARKDVTHHEDKHHEPAGLELGDVVRIIREPWFGKIGKVSELPPELTALDTEAKVRVLRVTLDDSNETVLLPRANIEKIEA